MKNFCDLEKGDKIYTFIQDEILGETVVETYYDDYTFPGEPKRKAFYLRTNKTEYPYMFLWGSETKNVYTAVCCESKFGLFIMATSIEAIKFHILNLRTKEIEEKKHYIENADKQIKLYEEFIDNFYTARDKKK